MKLAVLLLAVAACSYGLEHDIMRLDVLQQASDTESPLLLPEDEAELSVLEQRRDELMALVEEMETAPADKQDDQKSGPRTDKTAKDRTGLRIRAETAAGDKAAAITADMDEPAKLEQQAKQAKTAKDAVKADIKSAQADAEDTQGTDKEAINRLIKENVGLRAKLAALQKSVQDDHKKVKKAEEEKQAQSLYTMGLDELRNLNTKLKKQIGIDGHTIKRINPATLGKMSRDDLEALDEDLKGVIVSSKAAEAEDKAKVS